LHGQKLILFRPAVRVGEQSTGGQAEPNADWTVQAGTLIEAELKRRQAYLGVEVVSEPELSGDDARNLAEHKALFGSVASSVLTYQLFKGNRLPTRKNRPFDWTIGEGARRVSDKAGARYGLFLSTEDQYGSVGRKVFQLVAGLSGIGVSSGVHTGYAGLVDLQTGQLIWINADAKMGGDVRTEEGARKRVDQLLEDFPGIVGHSGK
jgi:hypothetical protein